jgi:hypothetical protein
LGVSGDHRDAKGIEGIKDERDLKDDPTLDDAGNEKDDARGVAGSGSSSLTIALEAKSS